MGPELNTAMAYLANEFLSTEFFNILRTRDQFGYVVQSSLHTNGQVLGLQFIVQSTANPSVIFNRIIMFLDEMVNSIENGMKIEEELSTHVSSIRHRLLEKPTNLLSEFQKLSHGILLNGRFSLSKIDNYANYFRYKS